MSFLKTAEKLARLFDMSSMKLNALHYMIGTEQQCEYLFDQRKIPGNKDKYDFSMDEIPIRTLVGYYAQKHEYKPIEGAFNPATRGIQMEKKLK